MLDSTPPGCLSLGKYVLKLERASPIVQLFVIRLHFGVSWKHRLCRRVRSYKHTVSHMEAELQVLASTNPEILSPIR